MKTTTEKQHQLRKLQNLEFFILQEVKRICDRYEIPYFLTGGTLLGAVRHGGFIPWDDDIDVGMTRDNYNRFLCVCEADLDEKFFLQTPLLSNILSNALSHISQI